MKRSALSVLAVSAVGLSFAFPALAQEAKPHAEMTPEEGMQAWMEMNKPGKEHAVMDALVGEFSATTRISHGPDVPVMEAKGRAVNRWTLDGRFIEGEFESEMMGMPFRGKSLSGYNKASKKYEMTWADGMSTHILFMTGEYDPKTKEITYLTKYHDPFGGGEREAKYVIRIVSNDQHVFEMWEAMEEGGEKMKVMEVTYERAGASPAKKDGRGGR